MDPWIKYRFSGATLGAPNPTMTIGASAGNGAVATPTHSMGRLSVESPMFWLLGLGAVTLGLVAASTNVRVGPLRASVSAGK